MDNKLLLVSSDIATAPHCIDLDTPDLQTGSHQMTDHTDKTVCWSIHKVMHIIALLLACWEIFIYCIYDIRMP